MSGLNGRRRRSGGLGPVRSRKAAASPQASRADSRSPGKIASGKAVHFDIPSDFHAGSRVLDEIVSAAESNGYDDDSIFGIKLALDEALINAIKHGNKLDAAKRVTIDATVTPRQIEVEIEDQGCGFNRACVPDPTADANIEKPSGRGILLIESYMNTVEWSCGGRRLRMVRRNEPLKFR